MALRDLDDKDQRHFLSRLARYGVDQQQLRDEELVVRKDTRLQLSHRSRGTLSPLVLKTNDIDVVRRWIGLPPEVTRVRYTAPAVTDVAALPAALRPTQPSFDIEEVRRRAVLRPSGALAGEARASGLRAFTARASAVRPAVAASAAASAPGEATARGLDRRLFRTEELEEVRTAARSYIRGDQRMASAYKRHIEELFGVFEIAAWFYTTVIVESGATLEFGKGANVLSAWKVIIEDGGTIRSEGNLTVDCTILTSHSPPAVGPGLADPVLTRPVFPH